jgi:uncharacterized protein YjdB
MRAFILAVTGLDLAVAACSSYGTSAFEVQNTPAARVASVVIALPSASLVAGQAQRANVTLKNASGAALSGRTVVWSTSAATVASVNDSGLVRGVSPGSATLSAVSEGVAGEAALTVVPVPALPVASVVVALSPSAVMVGQTAHATATLLDSTGSSLTGRSVAWQSGNPGVATVSVAGDVSAVAPGSAAISATSEGKTASALLTVSAPAPAPVASVSVSPGSPTVNVGDSVQFSAVTRDANNNVLTGRAIAWNSSNPAVTTVSASGLARTLAAGTAQISATSETQVGNTTLTVTSPPPPPPPGGGPVWRGNEPSGMTFINERPFNSLNEDPAWDPMASPGATIASDPSAPKSPSSVLSINFPAGFAGGSAPEFTSITVPAYRVFYFCYWVEHSSNWQGHSTGISKHGYVWMGNNPLFVYEAEGSGSNPLTTRMALQGVVAQPNSDGWYPQNLVPNATFTRGQWDLVEILLTGNTAGNVDGAMDVYLNGVHVSHWTGIQYSSGTTAWDYFRIYPVWGGIGDVVTADQYIRWDHVYMSGKN